MAYIPGIIFVIIGVIVSITSYFFVEEIFIFTYVGLSFVAYGILKMIYKKITSPKKETPIQHNNQVNHKKRHYHHPHCPNCNIQVGIHNNFCHNCGTNLKNQGSNPNFQNPSQHQYNQRR